MILVDTSVLIDFLKNKRNDGTDKFNRILELSIPKNIVPSSTNKGSKDYSR